MWAVKKKIAAQICDFISTKAENTHSSRVVKRFQEQGDFTSFGHSADGKENDDNTLENKKIKIMGSVCHDAHQEGEEVWPLFDILSSLFGFSQRRLVSR